MESGSLPAGGTITQDARQPGGIVTVGEASPREAGADKETDWNDRGHLAGLGNFSWTAFG